MLIGIVTYFDIFIIIDFLILFFLKKILVTEIIWQNIWSENKKKYNKHSGSRVSKEFLDFQV